MAHTSSVPQPRVASTVEMQNHRESAASLSQIRTFSDRAMVAYQTQRSEIPIEQSLYVESNTAEHETTKRKYQINVSPPSPTNNEHNAIHHETTKYFSVPGTFQPTLFKSYDYQIPRYTILKYLRRKFMSPRQ